MKNNDLRDKKKVRSGKSFAVRKTYGKKNYLTP